MRYRSLFRVIAIQMVVVLVMFFITPAEAYERGGGGRGGGYSREGQARGGGFSSSKESSSGARNKEYSQSEHGGSRQEGGGSHEGQRSSSYQGERSNEGQRSNEAQRGTSNEGERGQAPRIKLSVSNPCKMRQIRVSKALTSVTMPTSKAPTAARKVVKILRRARNRAIRSTSRISSRVVRILHRTRKRVIRITSKISNRIVRILQIMLQVITDPPDPMAPGTAVELEFAFVVLDAFFEVVFSVAAWE